MKISTKEFIETCKRKQSGENISWNEIADIAGLPSGESARSKWKRIRKQDNTVEDLFDENDIKKIQTRQELSEIRKYKTALARTKLLGEYIEEAIKNLEPYAPVKAILNNNYTNELVVQISDVHVGEIVTFQETNNLNKYDYEIFKKRMEKFKQEIIKIIELFNISKVHILCQGDLLDNDRIYKLQKATVEFPVVQQFLNFDEYFSGWLNDLSQYALLEVEGCNGNHGRTNSDGRDEDFYMNNFEYLLFHFLKLRLKDNKNIKINITEGFFGEKNILGYDSLFLHGEYDQNKQTSLNAYISMFKKHYTYMFTGHLHYNNQIDNNGDQEILQNGSVVGCNDHSIKKFKKATSASQNCYIFRSGVGKYCSFKINLQLT